MAEMSTGKRIAKNTIMLYSRQILIMLISLYTVRVVLEILGVVDYGIYNVIAGIVTLFSFLSGTMASATQRFFSFALGQRDEKKLKSTFTVNIVLYAIIAVVAVVLLETFGLWFVSDKLNIPVERFASAQFLFHFSVLTFTTTIFSAPFMAIIIAHEDMHLYAFISVIEVVLKLIIVLLLVVLPWEKLEIYGVLLFGVSVITTLTYMAVCMWKYSECQFRDFYWDKELLHEIGKFTGWTLFGQISTVGRNQAVTIMLNQFFSPVVVAARAIALSVANQINIFSTNFNVGLYPPIIKSYASNKKEEMFSLIINGSKITFYLMWVFALPLFLTMDVVLQIWLKTPPPGSVLFTRLVLCDVILTSISLPLITAARAPGNMKVYELTLGSIQIAIFFVSWFVLKMGGAAYTVFVVALLANVVMFFVRLLIVKKLVDLDLVVFIKKALIPISFVVLVSTVPSVVLFYFLPKGLWFSFLIIIFAMFISTISMYFIGLDKTWRIKVKTIIFNKLFNKQEK